MMKTLGRTLLILTAISNISASAQLSGVGAIQNEILKNSSTFNNLSELTAIGPRLSGSPAADRAVQWAKSKMAELGFEKVRLQPVVVPRWERGQTESAKFHQANLEPVSLKVAALGNSVGTSASGIEAQVIEVHSLQEVQSRRQEVRGKIVFYNRPMDPTMDSFEAYGGAVDQRVTGPSQAARFGAVAVLVRSLTSLVDDDHPHTGILSYAQNAPKIPAAALSTHAANVLSAALQTNPNGHLKLVLSAKQLAPVTSYNVMGEITGSEKPEEVIVVGGHLDSWDLSVCAHDDGAGVVQSLEVLRALKALKVRPKRTVRVVLFMTEEFGGIGAAEYARQAGLSNEKHIAALESDRGGFAPRGFEVSGGEAGLARLNAMAGDLKTLKADQIIEGSGGTDVDPLESLGALTIGYVPDPTHYFDLHHSSLDTLDKVNAEDLAAGAAAMATVVYKLAEEGI